MTHRPVVYANEEPQQVVLVAADGQRSVHHHEWSGISYAEARGATVTSRTTGNCTSTRELADCLRRLLFHDEIPGQERFAITSEPSCSTPFKPGFCVARFGLGFNRRRQARWKGEVSGRSAPRP